MTLQEIAWIASGLSLVVATATFIFSTIDRIKRERREGILKWQRVIVYSIIEQGASTFHDIKTRYLQAVQTADLNIPKTDIQDYALKLVLLSLQEEGLIFQTAEHGYVIRGVDAYQFISLLQNQPIFDPESQIRIIINKAMSKVFEMVESHPGTYTIDSLHRRIKEQGIDVDYDHFNIAIRMAIGRNQLAMNADYKLEIPRSKPLSSDF